MERCFSPSIGWPCAGRKDMLFTAKSRTPANRSSRNAPFWSPCSRVRSDRAYTDADKLAARFVARLAIGVRCLDYGVDRVSDPLRNTGRIPHVRRVSRDTGPFDRAACCPFAIRTDGRLGVSRVQARIAAQLIARAVPCRISCAVNKPNDGNSSNGGEGD